MRRIALCLLFLVATPAAAQIELDVQVIAGNTLRVTMGPFRDLATGEPATPATLTYRIDAPVRREAVNLLAPVTITPDAPTVVVLIPHASVRMYGTDVDAQTVEMTVTWMSPSGHQGRQIARFRVVRSRFGQ